MPYVVNMAVTKSGNSGKIKGKRVIFLEFREIMEILSYLSLQSDDFHHTQLRIQLSATMAKFLPSCICRNGQKVGCHFALCSCYEAKFWFVMKQKFERLTIGPRLSKIPYLSNEMI